MSVQLPTRGSSHERECIETGRFHASNVQQLNNDVNQTLIQLLSLTDMQRFSWASSHTLHATVHSANIIKPREVREFIDKLIASLDDNEHSEIIRNLNVIKANFHTEQFANLPFLKLHILDVKKLIVGALLSLDNSVIDSFKRIPLPNFFENFFEVLELSIQLKKNSTDSNSFEAMLRQGKLDTLLEVSDILFKNNPTRIPWLNLKNFSVALCKVKEWDQAMKIANLMVDPNINHISDMSSFTFLAISESFCEARDWDRAIETANLISNDRIKYKAFKQISIGLANIGEFERALQVAAYILPVSPANNTALQGIFNACCEQKDWDNALRVVDRIFCEHIKNNCHSKISDGLFEEERYDEAINFALLITTSHTRNMQLKKISDALAKAKKWEKANEVANLICSDDIRNQACKNIIKNMNEMQNSGADSARGAFF
ncbi:MAG: hypothetical protein COT84_00085 [Chlamydiae bacterium CG10_big_fil_rev_8_21_14_0_10_35_9]|nr:MAG: hypothetical protein COT84_00085 [Chlamydiae bacterium CG10_big_fil_rev_8_21_14_0_10_35_9]